MWYDMNLQTEAEEVIGLLSERYVMPDRIM